MNQRAHRICLRIFFFCGLGKGFWMCCPTHPVGVQTPSVTNASHLVPVSKSWASLTQRQSTFKVDNRVTLSLPFSFLFVTFKAYKRCSWGLERVQFTDIGVLSALCWWRSPPGFNEPWSLMCVGEFSLGGSVWVKGEVWVIYMSRSGHWTGNRSCHCLSLYVHGDGWVD